MVSQDDILGTLVGKTAHHVQNFKNLAEELEKVVMDEEDILNSHDVVSLFTNTPIDQVLKIVKDRLEKVKILKEYNKEHGYNLESEDIVHLLQFILTTTYFTFRGKIFRQVFGTAMGSPVSPIAANIFMEALEQQAIATAPLNGTPKLWLRYVDDNLEIVNKDCVEDLTDHINKVDESGSIKFTFEKESEGKLPFLDTLIVRKEDGSLKLLVHRKPTHTDQYLNYESHHPLHQKLGVIRTLIERITSWQRRMTREKKKRRSGKHWKHVDIQSGLLKKLKIRWSRKHKRKSQKRKMTQLNAEVWQFFLTLMESQKRSAEWWNRTTWQRLVNLILLFVVFWSIQKDKRDDHNTTDALYCLPCMNCDLEYIGETGRKFGTRLNEHKTEVEKVSKSVVTRASRKQSLSSVHKSAVTDHVVEKNHVIRWGRAKGIGTEQNRYKRWVKEAIEIRKRRGATMNRDEGQYFLSHVFDELLLEKSPKRRKPTGNTRFPASGNSTSVGSSSLI